MAHKKCIPKNCDCIKDDLEEIARIKNTLKTLIAWIATSSVSPINMEEAGQLLKELE